MDAPGTIQPASVAQVRKGRDGGFHIIDDDAGGVAAELRRINPHLKLRYSDAGGYYVVYFDDGQTHYQVLTAMQCDHRITDRIRYIDPQGRSGYDFAKEIEQANADRREAAATRFRKALEDHAAELQFALRKDLAIKDRVFIGKGIPKEAV